MDVRLDLDAIRANARDLRRMIPGDVVGVVKGVDARREVVEALLGAGIDRIAVSRIGHLLDLRDVDAELILLRPPRRSEIPAAVSAADVALHGSLETLRRADDEARRRETTHEAIPMVDAGDGREGVPLDDAASLLDAIEELEAVTVREVGINLGCFGGDPDPERVRRAADRLPDYSLSVGGSGMVPIRDELPDAAASFRVGDAILTGKYGSEPIEGLRRGAVELRAEVLASHPDRSVVDVGNVTTDPRQLAPNGDFEIERWSNELAVLDAPFEVGREVSFEMEYDAIATTFNCGYA